jgi:hypothetical protein
MSSWDPTKGGPDPKSRRSQRVIVSVPVTVSNEGGSRDAAFHEETQTLVVNAHGAMIAIAAKVTKGQMVRVKNRATEEEHVCKVVYLGPASGGKVQVGVDFTSSSPDFWRIAFPPEDWVVPAPDLVPTAVKKKKL